MPGQEAWQDLGIVTGLRAESSIVRHLAIHVAAGGGTPAGARDAAETLAQRGISALLSFGLAGGLDPQLPPGTVIIPRRVVSASGVWQTDTELAQACGGATADSLFAGQKIAANRREKADLHRLTGAAAIDLESGEVAAVAAQHAIPFAVLRVICDAATRDLPPAALAALDASGAIRIGRIALSLLRAPWQLPLLLALARDAATARRALATATARFSSARLGPAQRSGAQPSGAGLATATAHPIE